MPAATGLRPHSLSVIVRAGHVISADRANQLAAPGLKPLRANRAIPGDIFVRPEREAVGNFCGRITYVLRGHSLCRENTTRLRLHRSGSLFRGTFHGSTVIAHPLAGEKRVRREFALAGREERFTAPCGGLEVCWRLKPTGVWAHPSMSGLYVGCIWILLRRHVGQRVPRWFCGRCCYGPNLDCCGLYAGASGGYAGATRWERRNARSGRGCRGARTGGGRYRSHCRERTACSDGRRSWQGYRRYQASDSPGTNGRDCKSKCEHRLAIE